MIRCGDDSVRWQTIELGLKTFQDFLPIAPEPAQKAMEAAGKVIELCELRLARRTANQRTIAFLDALPLGR